MSPNSTAFGPILRFVLEFVAGIVGLLIGASLGAAAGRLISGEQGLHGFDPISLTCLVGGAIIGLFAGARLGNVIAKRWTRHRDSLP